MDQNIFDNDVFFKEYKKIRDKQESYNNLIEQPAMRLLLPDLNGKSVLDMGCGFGYNCADFLKRGAAHVVGIDISEKMLDVARAENSDESIQYLQLEIERVNELDLKFDFIYSSLALHYIADFEELVRKIHDILNDDGILLFSQEHPMVTAPLDGPTWIKNEQGVKVSAPVSNYLEDGKRTVNWIIDGITKYHRSFSSIINAFTENGFSVLKVVEPTPTEEVIKAAPHMYDEVHRPTSIIIKAQKKC